MEKDSSDSKGIKKIVVIGPESTGKSTLSSTLAKHYATTWVQEHARTYIDELNRSYKEHDLIEIAKEQLQLEDNAIKKTNKLLICDTNLITIQIWSEYKYGRCAPEIIDSINSRKYDLYLITNVDIPWADDPQREHPHLREFFFDLYKNTIKKTGVPYIEISGEDFNDRLITAINAIDKII
ncbi:MAG: ATP-binding protein [Cyclobacteriaceae bacterium]|nr:ATP-binding protein [Cyclobacteriaceae bacterium]